MTDHDPLTCELCHAEGVSAELAGLQAENEALKAGSAALAAVDTHLLDALRAENQRLRTAVTIAEDALHAIVSPDCMVRHDHPDGGGWIDTEAPGRIAEGALEGMRHASDDQQAQGEAR